MEESLLREEHTDQGQRAALKTHLQVTEAAGCIYLGMYVFTYKYVTINKEKRP